MGRNFKLNDIYLILLSTAAERDKAALMPAAASIADKQEQVSKGLARLGSSIIPTLRARHRRQSVRCLPTRAPKDARPGIRRR